MHVINVDIQDNHEEATLGAFLICELCQCVSSQCSCSCPLLWAGPGVREKPWEPLCALGQESRSAWPGAPSSSPCQREMTMTIPSTQGFHHESDCHTI